MNNGELANGITFHLK